MNRFCHDCGIFHPVGGCETIRELRARLVPKMAGQLTISDFTPVMLCITCGQRVEAGEMFCLKCEAAIRVAEHQGVPDNLSAAERAALELPEDPFAGLDSLGERHAEPVRQSRLRRSIERWS